jgi:DNA-binding MurR/RpiR family transcriptional regulator
MASRSPNPDTPEVEIVARLNAAMPDLTPGHRRMAEFVLANLFQSATMRIDELADAVGASVATANRFARALGFDGYPAFRDALVRGFEATLAPVERLRTAQESPTSGAELFGASLEQAEVNLRSSRQSIDSAAAAAAVDAILNARRVYIVGSGTSAFLAGLMELALLPYLDNVQALSTIGGPTHAARRLFGAGSEDLLIGIAFPRYVDDTIKLSRRAAHLGVRVLALTDSVQSPLARFADLTLLVRAERRLAANSEAAVLAVIEALCDAVALRAKHSVEAAAVITESVLPWLTPESAKPAATPASAAAPAHHSTRSSRNSISGSKS